MLTRKNNHCPFGLYNSSGAAPSSHTTAAGNLSHSQDTLASSYSDTPTLVEPDRVASMAEINMDVPPERRVSFGIGGAGNLRRMSEREKASKELEEITAANTRTNAEAGTPPTSSVFPDERRRSSIWSLSSNEGSKKDAIMSIFRRGSKSEDGPAATPTPSVKAAAEAGKA